MNWTNNGNIGDGDVREESAAYTEFLEKEKGALQRICNSFNQLISRVKSQEYNQGLNDNEGDIRRRAYLKRLSAASKIHF